MECRQVQPPCQRQAQLQTLEDREKASCPEEGRDSGNEEASRTPDPKRRQEKNLGRYKS